MARKHDAARDIGADRGIEIGLLARLVIDPEALDAPVGEIGFDEVDERDVAVAARRVESNEAGQHVARRIVCSSHEGQLIGR